MRTFCTGTEHVRYVVCQRAAESKFDVLDNICTYLQEEGLHSFNVIEYDYHLSRGSYCILNYDSGSRFSFTVTFSF